MPGATGVSPALEAPSAAQRRLRLVGKPRSASGDAHFGEAPQSLEPAGQVLVAASDACARERMLTELRSLLPPDTRFVEAGETWELVARTPGSRMVVLAGEVGEMPADSLLRLLGRRNPSLPVLVVGDSRRLRSAAVPGVGQAGGRGEALDALHA
jgi:hypothetical protein